MSSLRTPIYIDNLTPYQNGRYDTSYTKSELAQLARENCLPATGTKAQLYQRLVQYLNRPRFS